MGCEKDGSDYVAGFAAGTLKYIQIRVNDIKLFDINTSGIENATKYNWYGYNAVYSSGKEMTYLVIEVPEVNLCFTYGTRGNISKTEMEGYAIKSNFKNLKTVSAASDVVWPDIIPDDLRIPSAKSIHKLDAEGDYSTVYEVNAVMGSDLVEFMQEVLRKYKGSTLDNVTTNTLKFMCSGAEDMPQLKVFYLNGDLVTFMYYIK
jgi:hypothetical protein